MGLGVHVRGAFKDCRLFKILQFGTETPESGDDSESGLFRLDHAAGRSIISGGRLNLNGDLQTGGHFFTMNRTKLNSARAC